MSLEDRRVVENVRSMVVPKAQVAMGEKKGSPLTLEIDWESFASSNTSLEKLEGEAFRDLTRVFGLISRDEMGKEALKTITKVVVHMATVPKEVKLVVANGTIDYYLIPGRQVVMESDMKKLIETAI